MKRKTPRAAPADPFAALATVYGGHGMFSPRCGYLHANGHVEDYSPQNTWMSMRRAVSACFGSVARRTRGSVWSESLGGYGKPVGALLAVVDSRGTFVWKQRIDFPAGMEETR